MPEDKTLHDLDREYQAAKENYRVAAERHSHLQGGPDVKDGSIPVTAPGHGEATAALASATARLNSTREAFYARQMKESQDS